jgi:hypothetical protein
VLRPTKVVLLNDKETSRIVDLIRPSFDAYASKYDDRKYPPDVYQNLLKEFSVPARVTCEGIRYAVLWKFGHLGKPQIPSHHEALISELQKGWPAVPEAVVGSPADSFDRLAMLFRAQHRYITVCFFLHLLRPTEIPIIDQHNFRAMNHYISVVRPGFRHMQRPSSYSDLITLRSFLSAIRSGWIAVEPSTVPNQSDLDRFLMMYGKALKSERVPTARIGRDEHPEEEQAEYSDAVRDTSAQGTITLPHGGPAAAFELSRLIQHIKKSGRTYIIQGQTQCAFLAHPKPASLDFWLRRNYAKNPDTKQAVNRVISQVVSTGRFEQGQFICPDSGHLCKGIRIVDAA